jgi:hypothetical protein
MMYSTLGEKWMRPHVYEWLRTSWDHIRIEMWRVDMCAFRFAPRLKRERRVTIDSIAIELKTSRVDEAVLQAINNYPCFHQSYVCFPEDRFSRLAPRAEYPCRATGVGILVVSQEGVVSEVVPPNPRQAQAFGGYLTQFDDRWAQTIHRSWLRTRNDAVTFPISANSSKF